MNRPEDGRLARPAPAAVFAALDRYGTSGLVCLAAGLCLFLALHVARLPLQFAVRVLGAAMCRVDAYVTAQATTKGRESPSAWAT